MILLTRPHTYGDTGRSLKDKQHPAILLRSRFFYAPHSACRASARPARSLGVSGSCKAPDALICVENTPTPLRVDFSLEKIGGIMPNTIKATAVPKAISSLGFDIETRYHFANNQIEAALSIIDAAGVLCELERAPVHQDAHPSANITTGGGYAHGRRSFDSTLPKLLEQAHSLVTSSVEEFGCIYADAENAAAGAANVGDRRRYDVLHRLHKLFEEGVIEVNREASDPAARDANDCFDWVADQVEWGAK